MTSDRKLEFTKLLKVLIVEDNQVDRRVLESMLTEKQNYSSFLRSTGTLAEATKLVQDNEFDAIVLDLNLPDSKGKDTLNQLNKVDPKVAIVVNTGAYEDDLGMETLSLGAQDFLLKGRYNAYVLNKVLHYAVERKRLETDLKDAYHQLKEAQEQLIHTEKMKVVGGLASGVAHEVKNPLATILYGITYLDQQIKVDDDKIAEAFSSIKEAVSRANSIVTDLLDFSSLSKLHKQNENLNAVIEKSLALTRHDLNKHHIDVVKSFAEKMPPVLIDRSRVEQVLVNLILNAISAMENGGHLEINSKVVKLTPSLSELPLKKRGHYLSDETVVMVEVVDNGPGISGEIVEKVFDPFFTTRRDVGGVGLGLAVSRNIMAVHEGEIIFENNTKGGAKATLIFKA